MRRVLLGVLVLIVAAAGAGGIYFFRLTAPVEVSDQVPVAPTLAVPAGAASPTRPVAAGVTPVGSAGTPVGSAGAVVAGTPGTPPVVASPVAGRVYRIDSKQSTASYAVGETFFFENNRHFVAVGTTSAVAGDILIDRVNPAATQVGEIVIDISQLRSDDSRRDNAIRRQWLESSRYPKATLKTTTIAGLPAALVDGTPYAFRLTGDLTIRTTTRSVTWEVTATLDGETLRGKATVPIKLTDFGIQPPKLVDLGVEDDVVLTLEFVAVAVP
jgi:polyisoprenoid-binding protein YceI